MIRILLVDDHVIVRKGVRDVIETHPDWNVCGEAGDGVSALAAAKSLMPDVAVVDIALPGMSGLVLTRRLQEVCPQLKTLLFSFIDDEETVASGIAAGAYGYLHKSEEREAIEAAISAVANGRAYVSPALAEAWDAPHSRRRDWTEVFTRREFQVIQLVAEGQSNKQIAHALDISVKTVEAHRAGAMRKADLQSVAELVRFAIKHRFILT